MDTLIADIYRTMFKRAIHPQVIWSSMKAHNKDKRHVAVRKFIKYYKNTKWARLKRWIKELL